MKLHRCFEYFVLLHSERCRFTCQMRALACGDIFFLSSQRFVGIIHDAKSNRRNNHQFIYIHTKTLLKQYWELMFNLLNCVVSSILSMIKIIFTNQSQRPETAICFF